MIITRFVGYKTRLTISSFSHLTFEDVTATGMPQKLRNDSPEKVPQSDPPPMQRGSPARRYSYAALGILFVAIGAVGAVLPGIPTVGPLLLASYLFTKSFPALEERLIRNKFFGRFLPYLDGSSEMSLKAKLTSILIMWVSISISLVVLIVSNQVPYWVPWLLVIAGLVGTIFILRFGKNQQHID